jgi:putative DNA primase/helicase
MQNNSKNNKKKVQIKKGTDLNNEPFKPIDHAVLIKKLLEKVEPIDFREAAGIADADEKLTQKHFFIIVVEKLIELAKVNNWGIALKDGFIYLFNGAYWKPLEPDQFKSFLGQAAEKMGVGQYFAKYYQFRDNLLKQFFALGGIPMLENENAEVKINLQNGTYVISDSKNKLQNFQRSDFLTYQLPFEFDERAEAPLFKQYLDRLLPDVVLQKILAQFIGYIFVSNLKLEKALLLYGSGANGKSVFFDIIQALLGENNISNFTLESLGHEYYRALLSNKLLNYGSEINGNIKADLIKQLISGEPITARLPYGTPFTIQNCAKLCFNANELPREIEHSEAYFRRFIIIPFNVTIPEGEQDHELSKKIIKNELSGVLNWVLNGLEELLAQKGFTKSDIVKHEIDKFKTESDTCYLFVEDRGYTKSTINYIPLKSLYKDYQDYCAADWCKFLNKINFRRRLEYNGITVDRKSEGQVVFLEEKSNAEADIFNRNNTKNV